MGAGIGVGEIVTVEELADGLCALFWSAMFCFSRDISARIMRCCICSSRIACSTIIRSSGLMLLFVAANSRMTWVIIASCCASAW